MKWHQVKEYFVFTRKERMGVFVLMLLIGIVYFIPEFLPETTPYYLDKGADTLFQIIEARNKSVDAVRQQDSMSFDNQITAEHHKLFTFDPNTLSEAGWKSLGLRDKTIKTILNFRSRGGRFRNAADIRKIYGLRQEEADILIPYVKIAIPESLVREDTKHTDASFRKSSPKLKNLIQSVEINSADSTQLVALPGIGSRLATRILAFRNRLGGFYSISQIAETFGLPDSTFQLIKPYLSCDTTALKQININTADPATLKNHPYFRWSLANAIVRFREQHGRFLSVSDLRKIEIITDETYTKIAPYVVTE